ncbi:hypothetical protein Q4F19_08505 [Sphingomonas sp. BIUV-7]|uniref:HTH cro/C1-type domain-containing protein n=1 Tax=Sphingomonas natans TaxID=3063330 RepID=A0ABT8Y9T4_9SPHN|nr:hypothetical protein [Sphingomonas sp. BIUV-7]MDO6414420.1 hypothetical protein [Sphingomonas sp. BIUV-7]
MLAESSLNSHLKADLSRVLKTTPYSLEQIAERTHLDRSLLSRLKNGKTKNVTMDMAHPIYKSIGESATLAMLLFSGGRGLKSEGQRTLARISLQAALNVIETMDEFEDGANPALLAEFDIAVHRLSRQVRPGARRGRPTGSGRHAEN